MSEIEPAGKKGGLRTRDGALVALALGDLNSCLRLGLTFLLVALARQISLPRPFDFAFLLGMALQAWGNAFSLFEDIGWYDKIVHFVLPMAVAAASVLSEMRERMNSSSAGIAVRQCG